MGFAAGAAGELKCRVRLLGEAATLRVGERFLMPADAPNGDGSGGVKGGEGGDGGSPSRHRHQEEEEEEHLELV